MRVRITRGTKNVFADLGFPDAETQYPKDTLACRLQSKRPVKAHLLA
jgi:hypothetical protein